MDELQRLAQGLQQPKPISTDLNTLITFDKKKRNKSVRWQDPGRLEEVKYFKMNDAPSAPSLSLQEVADI